MARNSRDMIEGISNLRFSEEKTRFRGKMMIHKIDSRKETSNVVRVDVENVTEAIMIPLWVVTQG